MQVFEILQDEFQLQTSLPWPVMLTRICGAVIFVGCIGFERELRKRPAGLRTHMLVALASACYCIMTIELMSVDYKDNVRMDPIRLIEAVTGGVAFLAAGIIVFARGEIQGLTTGASLWLAASIGLAVGLGQWLLAITVTVFGLFITRVLGALEGK